MRTNTEKETYIQTRDIYSERDKICLFQTYSEKDKRYIYIYLFTKRERNARMKKKNLPEKETHIK